MSKDYYKTLCLPRTATEDDIKKAYRQAALKHHPDKSPEKDREAATIKFKEVAEAYEVLSDPKKRSIYDQYGEDGLKNAFQPPQQGGGATFTSSSPFSHYQPSNAEDIFKQFFGGRNPFEAMGGGGQGHSSFGAASFGGGGGQSPFGVGGQSPFGSQSMFSDFGPSSFGGGPAKKQKQQKSQSNGGVVSRTLPVSLEDLFSGTVKKLKVTRKRNGVNEENILEVKINRGWKSGTKIKFDREGDEYIDQSTGQVQRQDIEFILEEKKHDRFQRDKDDLKFNLDLQFNEVLCGFSKNVMSLDGRAVSITGSEGSSVINVNKDIIVPGEGMPNQKTGIKGNLVVKLNVKWPSSISVEQKNTLRSMFGRS